MVAARHAMPAVLRGRHDQGRRLEHQVDEAGRACRLPDAEALVGTIHCMITLETGTPEQGAETAEGLLDFARDRPGHLYEATAGEYIAVFGQVCAATAAMQRVLPQALTASGPRRLGSVCALARIAAAAHDRAAAERLRPILARFRGQLVIQGGAAGVCGPAAFYEGLLASDAGHWNEAVELFTEAAALRERSGALPGLAHARACDGRKLFDHYRPSRGEARRDPGDRARPGRVDPPGPGVRRLLRGPRFRAGTSLRMPMRDRQGPVFLGGAIATMNARPAGGRPDRPRRPSSSCRRGPFRGGGAHPLAVARC